MRGLSGIGNYRLKNIHSGAAVNKGDFPGRCLRSRKKIVGGAKLDCDIINFCQKLLRDKHPDIGGFQDTRYAFLTRL